MRFSTQDINIVKRVGPEGFGYNAFPMPFEANIDLQTAPQPPATTNGNKLILGGSGTFNDTSGSVATALSGGETLNVYGTVYDATFLINASDNGLLLFNGASNSPNNGDLATQPGATTLASLWDDWVGARWHFVRVRQVH